MAPNPFFSGRIPKDLYDRIAKHIEETGESKTQLLINALAAYLNYSAEPSNLTNSTIDKRLNELEKRINSLDALDREVRELRYLVTTTLAFSDNSGENKLDNISTPTGQLSILEAIDLDNRIDNEFDNTSTQEVKDLTETIEEAEEEVEEFPSNTWEYLGRMHIPEILELEELQYLDSTKLKNKLRNAKHAKKQTTEANSYAFKIVGKEPGAKGQLIYKVYRKR